MAKSYFDSTFTLIIIVFFLVQLSGFLVALCATAILQGCQKNHSIVQRNNGFRTQKLNLYASKDLGQICLGICTFAAEKPLF